MTDTRSLEANGCEVSRSPSLSGAPTCVNLKQDVEICIPSTTAGGSGRQAYLDPISTGAYLPPHFAHAVVDPIDWFCPSDTVNPFLRRIQRALRTCSQSEGNNAQQSGAVHTICARGVDSAGDAIVARPGDDGVPPCKALA